jgi:hypothetical protein
MATFLDKNKKKSTLALLLLFLRARKTVTLLLLMVALASFLFVSPSNFLIHLPGGARLAAGVAWIAGKVGVDTSQWGLAGGKRDYGDLLAAFRAAKDGGGKAGWNAFMRGGKDGAGAGQLGGSSLDFVKGNAKDLEGAGANKLPQPGSVDGVLNPDDAKNRAEGEGVALSEDDLNGKGNGMVKTAFAGGFGSASAFGNSGFGKGSSFGDGSGANTSASASNNSTLSGGAFASSGFFGGKGAVTGKLSDIVKSGTEGISSQPGKGTEIKGAAKGQMSAARAAVITGRTQKGFIGSKTISGQRAFVQLAAGRGRAAISVTPNCTADSGCPSEFAATNTGAVYDGNTVNPKIGTGPGTTTTDILTAPEIGDFKVPNLPDTGIADQYIKDAEKMDADARKCQELDDKYAPLETAIDKRQEVMSKEFDSMGCGQGGCSKSKAKACQKKGDDMKALCRENMTLRCKHISECPLTANNNCSASECDGPARNKVKITETNNGIRSTTKDMGEDSGSCIDAKQIVAESRQAARNALDQYKGAGCEALYTATAALDKLKYISTCSGRESQAVNSCKNYASTLCSSAQACEGAQCSGNTDACDISDVPSMEQFINAATKY